GARPDLAHLRVHRAGVDGARFYRLGRAGRRVQITLGISDELRPAADRAEMMRPVVMPGVVGRRRRVNCHAADGIDRLASLRRGGVSGTSGVVVRHLITSVRRVRYTRPGYCANYPIMVSRS